MSRFIFRLFLFGLITIGLNSFSYGQLSSNTNSSSILKSRYKIDFEIKENIKIDDALFNRIDFTQFELLRQDNSRVEFKDAKTNLTIVLYSRNEVRVVSSESPVIPIIIKNQNE